MFESIDQLGTKHRFEKQPKRIVSLVPSQTELLYYLGLENEVIGVTKFCMHPNDWFKNKTRIEQHKMVNNALKEHLGMSLHALQIKTFIKD